MSAVLGIDARGQGATLAGGRAGRWRRVEARSAAALSPAVRAAGWKGRPARVVLDRDDVIIFSLKADGAMSDLERLIPGDLSDWRWTTHVSSPGAAPLLIAAPLATLRARASAATAAGLRCVGTVLPRPAAVIPPVPSRDRRVTPPSEEARFVAAQFAARGEGAVFEIDPPAPPRRRKIVLAVAAALLLAFLSRRRPAVPPPAAAPEEPASAHMLIARVASVAPPNVALLEIDHDAAAGRVAIEGEASKRIDVSTMADALNGPPFRQARVERSALGRNGRIAFRIVAETNRAGRRSVSLARFGASPELRLAAFESEGLALQTVEVSPGSRPRLSASWNSPFSVGLRACARLDAEGARLLRTRVCRIAGASACRWIVEAEPGATRPLETLERVKDPFHLPTAPAAPRRPPRRRNDETARLAAEAARAAEAEARRRREAVTAGVALSAVFHNGREPVALAVLSENGASQTLTLRAGDEFRGARVQAIDEAAGTVTFAVGDAEPILLRAGRP